MSVLLLLLLLLLPLTKIGETPLPSTIVIPETLEVLETLLMNHLCSSFSHLTKEKMRPRGGTSFAYGHTMECV